MDITVVQNDTTPVPFTLTDINSDPVITIGSMAFTFDTGPTTTPTFSVLGTGTISFASTLVDAPGTFRGVVAFTNAAGTVKTRPIHVVVLPTTAGYDPYDTFTFGESAEVTVA